MKTTNPEQDTFSFNSSPSAKNQFPSQKQIIDWLQLYRSTNVGPATFFQLIEKFGSVEEILSNFNEIIHRSKTNRVISLCDRGAAEKEFEEILSFGGEIIIHTDPRFPSLLKEIYDCPPLISIKGDANLLCQDKIAVVGPRNPSANAITIAKKITLMIGKNSLLTVSGMARGIDSVVHHASILSGTVAVLAGGIDNIYPSENLNLYREIGKTGIIISEMPFGYVPKASNFVQRNRIVSGLSKAVIVVEAGLKSGSLITARFAMDQGREVYAVPGSPFDPRCHGVNLLIKEGAEIISNLDEIEQEFNAITKEEEIFAKNRNKILVQSESFKANKHQDYIGMDVDVDDSSLSKINKNISMDADLIAGNENEIEAVCKKILEIISSSPISLEELVFSMEDAPINLINIALTHLELLEKIEICQGKIILLA